MRRIRQSVTGTLFAAKPDSNAIFNLEVLNYPPGVATQLILIYAHVARRCCKTALLGYSLQFTVTFNIIVLIYIRCTFNVLWMLSK